MNEARSEATLSGKKKRKTKTLRRILALQVLFAKLARERRVKESKKPILSILQRWENVGHHNEEEPNKEGFHDICVSWPFSKRNYTFGMKRWY